MKLCEVMMMPLIKTRGIVIKVTNLGEGDKIITLFTDRLGKIEAVVHGARKAKNKFMSSSQIFSYCEYVLYKGKSLYTVSQAEIVESFQVLLSDLYTLTYGSYIIELANVLSQNDEANLDLFLLILKTLYLMTDSDIDRELLIRAFEIKSVSISGYMPILDVCSICRKEQNNYYFSTKYGGIICEECLGSDNSAFKINCDTLNVMRYLTKSGIERVRTIKVSKSVKKEMKKILKNYIKYYLEKEFKSLEFLDDIERIDK